MDSITRNVIAEIDMPNLIEFMCKPDYDEQELCKMFDMEA